MSWSIDLTGRPEKVAAAIEGHGERIAGSSATEYAAAAPHLAALCRRIFERREAIPADLAPLVRVRASGSGIHDAGNGAEVSSSVTVSIEPIYTRLV